MVTELMVQPSSWIKQGITIKSVRGLQLFKFTDELQQRLKTLIDIHKAQQLTPAQEAELKGLQELDRIFTLLNAKLIAETEYKELDPDDTPKEVVLQGLREGLQEALLGQTIPLSQMWDGIDAE